MIQNEKRHQTNASDQCGGNQNMLSRRISVKGYMCVWDICRRESFFEPSAPGCLRHHPACGAWLVLRLLNFVFVSSVRDDFTAGHACPLLNKYSMAYTTRNPIVKYM